MAPVVSPDYTVTTFADSLSALIIDDASGATTTLDYGSTGVFASTFLTLDGVEIAVVARSSAIALNAGNDVTITSSGLLGGGTVAVDAGNMFEILGVVEGGEIGLSAESNLTQAGRIEASGTGNISVSSATGQISLSGTASTVSESGSIIYQAAGNLALVSVASTDSGRIDIVSDASITDSLTNGDLNLSSGGFISMTAQTGIELSVLVQSKRSPDLYSCGIRASGDIVAMAAAVGSLQSAN